MSLVGIIRRSLTRSWRVYDRALSITREGWFFTGFIFALGIAAINTGNNLLYLVLAVMLGAMVASGVLSEESVRKLHIERELPHEAWAGEEFQIHYYVRNPRKRGSSYGIKLIEVPLETVREAFFIQIPAGAGASNRGVYRHNRRGILKLNELRIVTRFPFSLFEKIRIVKIPEEMIVYPHPMVVDAASVSGSDKGISETLGAYGEGADLHALRPYVEGDSPRSIHWKASARSEGLVTKVTRSENMPTVTVVLDTSGYGGPRHDEALESAVSKAAGYVKYFLEEGYMVRLLTDEGEIPFGSGRSHTHRLMRALALYEPKPGRSVAAALRPDENKIIVSMDVSEIHVE